MADVEPKGETLNIVIKDSTAAEVQFRVKATTKMEKIFKAYAEKKALNAGAVKFLFDGQRVQGHQTPADLGMEDGDSMDAMLEQLGGSLP
ncbi:hypothetical protein Rsub_12978 [Raphidocelis subcapitata]|uniref:Small ubiquitin-related modifier n=1 Tax=Raphidocelis subcapitata TaxID=307507 RepID=A0A2V0PK35_9CHLO|nr:hypothetical protein Rsub_12978 [Raphidocelis subcapitata]|eukprot:GBG00159.1 hypothetical protein Rsub_12978 [Raphidocelis subcapitata]